MAPLLFNGGFLIYTIMKELQIEIKRNENLKKLFELRKENDELEKSYNLMIEERQRRLVKELLDKRKQIENKKN
jgi:hypothetical protein